MRISPLVLAVRAVSAEFAQRIYLPIVAIVGAALLVLLGFSIWFVFLSEWWWFLLAPVIFLTLIFIFAATIGGLILRMLRPRQTKAQRYEVSNFVDSLQKSSEVIHTPKFLIFARLIKDILLPGKESYVRELTSTAGSLQKGLKAIIASFQ